MKPLEFSQPHLLVAVGLPGSGKTFFAQQFHETFSAPYVDYAYFHELTGSQELGDVVATELLDQLFLTKRSIVIEGRGETKQDRALLMQLAQSRGYDILFVWVQTEPQTNHRRAVSGKDARYTQSQFDDLVESFEHLGKGEPYIVISGKHTFASQGRMVLKRLAAHRTAAAGRQQVKAPERPAEPKIKNHGSRSIIG